MTLHHRLIRNLTGWRRLRFQIMSDLHLEVDNQYNAFKIPVKAPILLLAGDIGQLRHYDDYLAFLERQCHNFKSVYLVLGNHEFYGISRTFGLDLAAKLESDSRLGGRLTILNRKRVDISEKVTILGCTLHSNIGEGNRTVIEAKLRDFTRIEGWTVQDHNEEHQKDLLWLTNQLAHSDIGRRIIVMTHHAPLARGCCHPDKEGNELHDGFATGIISNHNALSRANWWIFGHTHHTTQLTQCGVNLVSNQRGYMLGTATPRSKCSMLNPSKHQFDIRKSIYL